MSAVSIPGDGGKSHVHIPLPCFLHAASLESRSFVRRASRLSTPPATLCDASLEQVCFRISRTRPLSLVPAQQYVVIAVLNRLIISAGREPGGWSWRPCSYPARFHIPKGKKEEKDDEAQGISGIKGLFLKKHRRIDITPSYLAIYHISPDNSDLAFSCPKIPGPGASTFTSAQHTYLGMPAGLPASCVLHAPR